MREILATGAVLGLAAGLLLTGPVTADPVNLATVAGVRIDGPYAGAMLGREISGAGDFDGDGYDDMLVGLGAADYNGRTDSGAVFVVFGGPSVPSGPLGSSRTIRIDGATANDFLGDSAAGVGDVNQDGYDDILLGAEGFDNGPQLQAGSAYLVLGSKAPTNVDLSVRTVKWVQFMGAWASNFTGATVAAAGDVNADGYPDMLIGAPYADNGALSTEVGTTYVVYGRATPTDVALADIGTAGVSFMGVTTGDMSGRGLSGLGDVNRDGVDDFAIGAPGSDKNGKNQCGSTYVILGGTGLYGAFLSALGTEGYRIDGVDDGESIGMNIAAAGDLNKDGVADIAIGSPNGAGGIGRVYAVYGGSTADLPLSTLGTRGFHVDGTASSHIAFSVAGIASGEVLIGAPLTNGNDGAAYVLRGVTGNVAATALDRYDGPATQSLTGIDVAGLGDVNGDGGRDFAVGAFAADIAAIDSGSVYVVFGNPKAASLTVKARKASKPVPRKARVTLVRDVVVGSGQTATITAKVKPKKTRKKARVTVNDTTVKLRTKRAPKGTVTVKIVASGSHSVPTTWTRTWKVR